MHINSKLFALLPVLLLSACSVSNQDTRTAASDSPLITITDNCRVGCPVGGSSQTLFREVYTLNNNSATKFANWVAYKVTNTSQASGRPRNWRQDPDLPASETLAPPAYNGANAALAVDRGHQAPLAGLGGSADWQALNYLSNITPQKAALNQGAWARVEDKERELAKREDISAVYVVTGPLFERSIGKLPNAPTVEIPSGYWKIIFTGSTPVEGKYAAFLMDQETPRGANFCDYQVTVENIEQKTAPQLTVWSELPEDISVIIKGKQGTLAQEMGCS